jgi:hypothetical protein
MALKQWDLWLIYCSFSFVLHNNLPYLQHRFNNCSNLFYKFWPFKNRAPYPYCHYGNSRKQKYCDGASAATNCRILHGAANCDTMQDFTIYLPVPVYSKDINESKGIGILYPDFNMMRPRKTTQDLGELFQNLSLFEYPVPVSLDLDTQPLTKWSVRIVHGCR